MQLDHEKIALIGLGYVGLPLAVEFGKKRPVIGFDIKPERIAELRSGRDRTLEVDNAELAEAQHLTFTSDPADLQGCRVYIVTVPTPIDEAKRPDLDPLITASATIGRVMPKGSVVIYESTVFPGATEEVCVPALERASGLVFNQDFFAGYSPERINPADKAHKAQPATRRQVEIAQDSEDALFDSCNPHASSARGPSIQANSDMRRVRR